MELLRIVYFVTAIALTLVSHADDRPEPRLLQPSDRKQSESVKLDIAETGKDRLTIHVTFKTIDGGKFYNVDAHHTRKESARFWVFSDSGAFLGDFLNRAIGSRFGPGASDWQTLKPNSEISWKRGIQMTQSILAPEPMEPGVYKVQFVYTQQLYADKHGDTKFDSQEPAIWSDIIRLRFSDKEGWSNIEK